MSTNKLKTQFVCTACGGISSKWAGKCPHCGEWNTLQESIATKPHRAQSFASNAPQGLTLTSEIQLLPAVDAQDVPRIPTGIDEFDRVLGGGLVRGGVILIGGDPGIGKSTLLLQALANLAQQGDAPPVLYVSGEESAGQIALRAKRLGLESAPIHIQAEIQLEQVLAACQAKTPHGDVPYQMVVIDSIQTVYTDQLQSAPGSVSQVRECAAQLTRLAKTTGICVIMVGHVTKDGTLAGPRVLEHIVDCVLYFEGDTHSSFRLVRAIKNRFGAVNELGVFAMTDKGLKGVSNPSAIFLSNHGEPVPGAAVVVTLEGTRPLLVEVQALVDHSGMPNPRRLSVGLEANRLAMLLAVLHRHAGVACFDQDVFINAVGGVKITEPAADLAVVLAIVSSLKHQALPAKLFVFGEIGLAGEIRPAPRGQERLREAAKLGFTHAIIPKANQPKQTIEGLTIYAVNRIDEALTVVRDLQ